MSGSVCSSNLWSVAGGAADYICEHPAGAAEAQKWLGRIATGATLLAGGAGLWSLPGLTATRGLGAVVTRAAIAGTSGAASDAAVQLALTGEIDPLQAAAAGLLSAVTAPKITLRGVPQAMAGADDAASIISSTARGQAARRVQGLQSYLSPAEQAAYTANPAGGSRFLGQAVHRATRDALDEAFPGRFIYRTRGVDFVDTWTGEMIELTTPGQVASHTARPGYRGASYAIYWLP